MSRFGLLDLVLVTGVAAHYLSSLQCEPSFLGSTLRWVFAIGALVLQGAVFETLEQSLSLKNQRADSFFLGCQYQLSSVAGSFVFSAGPLHLF